MNEHYDAVIKKIEESLKQNENQRFVVGATSCFNLSEVPESEKTQRNQYFDRIASLIASKRDFRYRVLFAKGDHKAPRELSYDTLCKKELQIRYSYIKRHQRPEYYWSYGSQDSDFCAKRSRLHNRIEFLIIGDSIFLNLRKKEGDAQHIIYLMIRGREIVDCFSQWFDSIWSNNDEAHLIEFDRNNSGGRFHWSNEVFKPVNTSVGTHVRDTETHEVNV